MRLKNTIKAQNTTQEWVAGKIGVPLNTFKKWMNRRTYPNLKNGIEIAKLLETTAEYLVTGEYSKGLSDDEQELINAYRKLNQDDRENIALAANAWLEKKIYR